MLPEFHMVLESAVNRGAKEVTLPIEIASGLKLHIDKLEEQHFKCQDDLSSALNKEFSAITRQEALLLAAALKVKFGITSLELGMKAAELAVKNGND